MAITTSNLTLAQKPLGSRRLGRGGGGGGRHMMPTSESIWIGLGTE